MKAILLSIALILVFTTTSFSQKTDFIAHPFPSVVGPGTSPGVPSNAYLAVSVLFRNESKLSDEKFLGKFNKVNYFYLEASVTDGQKTETAPLYFLKKENGGIFAKTTFSTKVFKDRTILRKVPFQKYAATIPNVNILINVKMEKEVLKIIKDISGKIAPIVQNPASLFGAGSIKLVYGFFDNILGQLNTGKEVQAEVAFDSFSPEETGIVPYRYSVVIMGPKNVTIQGSKFQIRHDETRSLQLYDNNILYTDYPYMIVLTGLSNYLDTDGIPSKYYAQNKICEITDKKLAELGASLETQKDKLSDEQQATERNLLRLLGYKVQIENGVVASPSEAKLIDAYNAFYDFKKFKSNALNDNLYSQHYKDMFTFYKECIDNSAQGLSLYKLLMKVFPVMEKQDIESITNADLEILKTYIETTKTLNFILNSKFNANAVTTQLLAEKNIYNSKFKTPIDKVIKAEKLNAEVKASIKTLIDLKSEYDQCEKCVTETQKAEQHYGVLVNNDVARRKEIEGWVEKANETLLHGSTAIQIMKLSEDKIDSTTNQPLFKLGFKVEDVTSLLSTIKLAKEDLNKKLSIQNFSQEDKNEIETTIRNLNDFIKRFDSDILSNVTRLIETNNKVLTNNMQKPQLRAG